MQVKEIMSCGVKSIAPDTKLVEVASLMCSSTVATAASSNRWRGFPG